MCFVCAACCDVFAQEAYLKIQQVQSSQLQAGHLSISALLLVILFVYNKRSAQLRLTIVGVGFIILKLSWGLYGISVTDFNFNTDFGVFLDLFSIMMLLLAHRAIRRDEALVRSIDRIR